MHNGFAFWVWPARASKPDSWVVGPPALHHCAMLNACRQARQCPFVAGSCYLHTNGRGHQAKLRWKVVWQFSVQIVVASLALAYGWAQSYQQRKEQWCTDVGHMGTEVFVKASLGRFRKQDVTLDFVANQCLPHGHPGACCFLPNCPGVALCTNCLQKCLCLPEQLCTNVSCGNAVCINGKAKVLMPDLWRCLAELGEFVWKLRICTKEILYQCAT